MTDLVPLEVRCLCGPRLAVSLPRSTFPLAANACHCRSCRLATGILCAHYVELPPDRPPFEGRPEEAGLKAYKSSEKLTRWHCPSCGSHLAVAIETSPDETVWSLQLGAIPHRLDSGGRTFDMAAHIYVQPEDGAGFASLFKDGLTRFIGEPDDGRPASARPTDEPASEELGLRCHCGRWTATLRRPPSTADPDAFKAYRARGDRWRMTCCACETCQRTSGYPFSCYFSVPRSAISSSTDSALTHIRSSAEVSRWFCPTCSASVYYQRAETRAHDCISVFAGTADATLAQVFQHWVWREKMLFPEEGEPDLTSTLLSSWDAD